MKTMRIAAIVIAIFAVMTSMNAKDIKATLTTDNLGAVKTQVFTHTSQSNKKFKMEYSLNTKGQVVAKKVLAWNKNTKSWKPVGLYVVNFLDGETVLTHAKWSDEDGSFSDEIREMTFDSKSYPEVLRMPNK